MKNVNIAIVGATGLVGAMTLSILEERHFPVDQLFLLASHRSIGETRYFKNQPYSIEDIAQFDFTRVQLAFFSVGNEIAACYAPKAAATGCIVIDKSSSFRNDSDVPLVVPEVNPDALRHFQKKNIIANPNCNTIPVAVALKPIYDAVGISRVNVATYQSVSGAGKEAVQELAIQTEQVLQGSPIQPAVFSQQMAFNVLPHIDSFVENGYTKEEMKMVWELQKIFQDTALAVNPTAVRVPVFYGHSAAVHLETRNPLSVENALALLRNAPSVKLIEGESYPTPVRDAAGGNDVYVGRVRKDISHPNGLNLWVVADNLRKGAALNAVQVAECLIKQLLI